MRVVILLSAALLSAAAPALADTAPTRDDARRALHNAVTFFHSKVARHGGYIYQYSGDLELREGEGKAPESVIWVQPPGTPLVGEAFLDAYDATGDERALRAARDAGDALVLGQLHSGGWFYSIDFDPKRRGERSYRYDLDGRKTPAPTSARDRNAAAGWDTWKRRKYEANMTTLDDDTTQAALRFLMRLDKTLGFQDARLHGAVEHGLASLVNIQYANGGWSANYDRFQQRPPDADEYPPRKAAYPDDWPRTWPKDFTGCYVTNDDLMANMVKTMLRAWEVYGEKRYLASAERAGEFLVLAQMPDPQPAWAQQYNREMHPVWDRAFEPPAISGRESQFILDALLLLYRTTGKERYLEPVPRAIDYLRKSRLADGKLARFYELKTNRPLYFTRGRGGGHVMTYERERLATNYAFVVDSRLDAIEAEYRRLLQSDRTAAGPSAAEQLTPELVRHAGQVIDSLDERGAWIERGGRLRHHRLEPASGIIESRRFAENVETLCRFLAASR